MESYGEYLKTLSDFLVAAVLSSERDADFCSAL